MAEDPFYLFWSAEDFGIASGEDVKAAYASLDDAVVQARHDKAVGRHPLRVEHPLGTKVWDAKSAKPQDARLVPGRPEYEVQLKTEAARKAR